MKLTPQIILKGVVFLIIFLLMILIGTGAIKSLKVLFLIVGLGVAVTTVGIIFYPDTLQKTSKPSSTKNQQTQRP